MAGDWIKMRVDLHTHPKVVRIVSAVCPQDVRKVSARCLIVGALHAMWSLFDAHSIDGELRGYGPETLDALVGLDGFAEGVASERIMAREPSGGPKIRRRNVSAECPQNVRRTIGQIADQRREEKRRS